MVYESIEIGKGTGGPTLGLALGALTFFFADRIISNVGASDRKAINPAAGSALVIPMLLGTMLANSMMPEAFEHGGSLAGLVTVLGFSVSVMVVLMERAG